MTLPCTGYGWGPGSGGLLQLTNTHNIVVEQKSETSNLMSHLDSLLDFAIGDCLPVINADDLRERQRAEILADKSHRTVAEQHKRPAGMERVRLGVVLAVNGAGHKVAIRNTGGSRQRAIIGMRKIAV